MPTHPTPHGQVPAIQRYKIGYHSNEWGVRSLSPTGIYDDAGPWVRYEDHVTALAAGQATAAPAQPAAQQGVAYATLPEKYYLAGGEVPTWDAKQMHAFADATHALRTTPVQNPAKIEHVAGDVSKNGAESNMAQQPAPSAAAGEPPGIRALMCVISSLRDTTHFSDEKGELTNDLRTLRDWAYAQAAAFQPSPTAQADSVQEDAARWQWLADYLIGERTDLDEGIVACATIDALRQFADAARKQGANHD